MYVVELDRPWIATPFFFHRKQIAGLEEVERFKKHGIREVVIDTQRGVDVETASPAQLEPEAAASLAESQAADRVRAEEIALQPLVEELETARAIHDEALSLAKSIFDGATGGLPANYALAKTVVADLLGSVARSPDANLLLVQMRRFDRGLFAHAVNVCVLSLVVATAEDCDLEIPSLGLGALLHDIGETRVPRQLLRNTGKLNDTERRLLEQHPRLGAMLLDQSGAVPESARQIVRQHHERIDGSGYPNQVAGDGLSLGAQIVAIADMYDDMFTGRNQAMLQPVEVLRQLFVQSHAGAIDRSLIERMVRCLGVYPVGSLVELNSGERGIVVAANRADTLRPMVRVVTSHMGNFHARGPILSLNEPGPGGSDRHIVRALDPGRERLDPMLFLKIAPASVGL